MRLLALPALVVALAASLVVSLPATAASSPGSGAPSCLRGDWVATQAETRRVMRALVPGGLFTAYGRLYMVFRGGAFQYGSTGLVLESDIGDARLTARARFFTLAPYAARPGVLTLRAGETTIEFGPMSGTKDGRTYTVPGPPSRTTRVPGGSTPYRCAGATLRVRLPRFAALDWITLRRGTR
jgi:hypothetical protein